MAGRRRPATRQTESVEPVGDLSARQTRRSTRRQEASVEPDPRPQAEIPQRGTRRRRRRSVESVATSDFLKNSAGYASPEPEILGLAPVPESVGSQSGAVSETDDTKESPEMEVARIQDMVDFDIPKLTRWTDKLYGTLSSINYSQPSVDDRSRFISYRKSYNHARLPFADNSTFFIKPINLSQKYDPEVRTKIQVAICSANIVSLLAFIMDVKLGENQLLPTLEQLDDGFPTLFDPHLQADDNNSARYLDLAFRIRCRRLVEALISDSSVEPFESAARVFCIWPGRDLRAPREALNKGPYKQLGGIDINQNDVFYDIHRARIKELISKLSSDRLQAQTILSHHCPQDRILNDLKSWALELYQLLNRPMDRCNIRHTNITPSKHTHLGREESEPLFVDDNARIEEDSDSASDIDIGGYDRLLPQDSNQSFIDSSATLAAVRQSEKNAAACSAITPPSNQQAINGKEKALNTRDAIRRLEPKHILDGVVKRLQPNRDSDNEDDDDDDFEVNEQLQNESKRALDEDESVQRPSPKRPRYSKQPQILSPRVARTRELSVQQSLDNSQEDRHLQDRDILVLSQGARNIRRANHANKPRQVRIPWSASETSRLLELIADPSLNCSWSAMEKVGGFENARNQQALRDKARGLKVWYLEGDRVLPAGFDQVALGQKEKDAVIRCGRNPDRREDDLDEDGQVTNNIWVG
ncbi:hypothetical protein F4776DRAFT_401797 [Hypoxylon sp. NC0597]|nr:hypothetical protein F4776DRAFT_401797 [Hypoxylon sp. NC0597]